MADIFDQMLSRYEILTKDDERNAKHEVMQQIALAGLYRAQFFIRLPFTGELASEFFMVYNVFQRIWIFLY